MPFPRYRGGDGQVLAHGCQWVFFDRSVFYHKGSSTSGGLCAAVPSCGVPSVSVATDDVIVFERRSPCTFKSGSVCPLFKNLDSVWQNSGIVGKGSKEINRNAGGNALGIDLVEGKFLLPKGSRLLDIMFGFISMLSHMLVSPADSGHFFGVVQWMLLANRPLLACCGAI